MSVSGIVQKLKIFQKPAERFIMPLVLLLWPLFASNQGINIADGMYSLGNYNFLGDAGTGGSTWFFATFLSNLWGKFLTDLPGGGTMLGMNIMTALTVSATALVSYYLLRRLIPGWMVFIGEFIAECLCWCPTNILYNYLTYFFLTLGVLFLFLAVTSVPEKKRWFILAGVCLGINVTVRFSNIAEAALILSLWLAAFWTHTGLVKTIRQTLLCILGYVTGFGAVLVLCVVMYGGTAYFAMIPQLFGMTSSASDYTLASMLSDTLSAYVHSLRWFLILIPCVIMGFFLFSMPLVRKRPVIGKTIYIAGILVVFRFFFSRGMFTVNYQDYWCMFQWAMLFVIMAIIECVVCMAGAAASDPGERFLAAASLILILILPLGSNNYTFPLVNCLFVIAPFALWMLRRFRVHERGKLTGFAWSSMAVALVLALAVQGKLFHMNFAFGDGTDGTKRTASVEGISYLKGMKTTPENAQSLTELGESINGNKCGTCGLKLIAMGNAPGLNVIFDREPALSTTWPDLDSYSTESFSTELGTLTDPDDRPLIIIHNDSTVNDFATTADKRKLLRDYIKANDYTELEVNAAYIVYTPE